MTVQAKTNSATHRRVVVSKHGGPDVLHVIEEALPEPQPGEVRVKVLAAGVSAYDAMLRQHSLSRRSAHAVYAGRGLRRRGR